MRLTRLTSAALASVFLLPACVFACRYNVRDLGFVDLEAEAYWLFAYTDKETPLSVADEIAEVARAALRDTNVRPELVGAYASDNHPGLKYRPASDTRLPTAVLVSPDGQTFPVEVPLGGQSFRESLRSTLEALTSSPTRTEIVRVASEAYGVVLLFEGTDPQQNDPAREAVLTSIERVKTQMGTDAQTDWPAPRHSIPANGILWPREGPPVESRVGH